MSENDIRRQVVESAREAGPPLPQGEGRGEGAGIAHALLPADILSFARELRRNQIDAENLLWSIVRGRRLGNFKFRRQHPLGRYILDFYCHDAKLSIELDGGQHNTSEGRRYDETRTQEIASQGIRELRFWNYEVLQETESVLEAIWNALHEQTGGHRLPGHPHPGPLPGEEGEKRDSNGKRPMNAEREIHEFHSTWIDAVNTGDLDQLLRLMADDVVYISPGQAPFGRDSFSANFSAAHQQFRIRCISELEEVVAVGEVAYTRSRDTLSVTPHAGGETTQFAGYRITVYRKQAEGGWVLARDAHTLTPVEA